MVPDGPVLAPLLEHFDDPDVVAAGGRAVPEWAAGRPCWFPEELDWVVGGSLASMLPRRAEVRNVHSVNMGVRKEAIAATGPFDTSFGRLAKGGQAGEEAELCLRLKHRLPGAKIIYDPEAVVRHKVPAWRGRWRYLVIRSYEEGRCKARIERLAQSFGNQVLSVEHTYLRHLLFHAIPSRLARFWRPAALAQIAAIVLCIFSTGAGYLAGRLLSREPPAT